MKYVDLHMHTIYSDGTLMPEDNVRNAAMLGTQVVAITDHDSTKGYQRALKEGQEWDVKVLSGVEITTPKFHILGYNFDVENRSFQELLTYSRECQANIVRQKIEILKDQGVPITFEKLYNRFPESRLGTGNLTMTLVLDKECRKYNGELTYLDAYYKYLGNGTLAKTVECPKVTAKDAISGIHQAGGIAIVAHPFKQVSSPKELSDLIKLEINGLEIQPNYSGKNKPFKEFAKEQGLIITYGSDYHGPLYLDRPLLQRNGNLSHFFK